MKILKTAASGAVRYTFKYQTSLLCGNTESVMWNCA